MISPIHLKKCMLLFFLLFSFSGLAQDVDNEEPELFVALYTTGLSWDIEKPPNEQAHFKEHSSFLNRLRKANIIVLGARYSDTGMIVVKAQNLEAAMQLLQSDIAVQQKLFDVEIHPFKPFYQGCLE